MAIIQQPDSLSLLGNLKKFIVSSGSQISFKLNDGATVLLEATYESGVDGRATIDVRDIVESRLVYTLLSTSFYEQASIAKTFVATIDGTPISFRVIRAGVAQLADTANNWLRGNFLTWQPTNKPVTYYSPEWLTYYAQEACTIKLKATFPDNTVQNINLGACDAGKAFTCNLRYSIIAGLLAQTYPSYYDVWVEDALGNRLTYIQRYLYSEAKSEQEQWFLFENSLGGLDTFRASGETDFTGNHEHKVSTVDDIASEYQIDTKRTYNKNTGYLDDYERRWLLDFFPSRKKYIYHQAAIRTIVVSESDVKYSASDLPSSYNFVYRFSDDAASALLNLIRNEDQIPEVITIPNLESPDFSLPPRLSEYPRVQLHEGVILPAFDPNTGLPSVTTFGIIRDNILLLLQNVTGTAHSHLNKSILDQLTQGNIDVLSKLSIVDGNLKIDANAYSTGELSAYGAATGSGGGTGVDLLQLWTDYDATKDNWAVKAGLLVPFYNDTTSRLAALESGAQISLSVTGTGNGVGSITKSGSVLTVTKVNFAELDATGKILSSQLPSYVDDVLEYASLAAFPATGESGKIYIAIDTNLTYRWSGTGYALISASIALGETSSTAYRGDRGKIAYDHSQISGNPHLTTFAQIESKPTTIAGYGITDSYTKTEINSSQALKLDKSIFDDLFVKVNKGTEAAPVWAIEAKYNFYSVGELSAYGFSTEGSGGGSFDRLDAWADYDSTKAGWVLSALLGNELNTRVGNLESGSALTFNTTGTGNAVTSISKAGTVITANKDLTFSLDNHLHTGVYEPVFSKNTAFNKNFGTAAGTVAEGNHTHSYLPLSGGTLTGNINITPIEGTLGVRTHSVGGLGYMWPYGGSLSNIRTGLDFGWYDTEWVIGNIRGGGTDSYGFGIGYRNADGNLNGEFRIAVGGIAYLNNVAIATVNSNVASATNAANADLLDGYHASSILKDLNTNYGTAITSANDYTTNLLSGIHRVHISNVEYASILTGYDFVDNYWQLRFRPTYDRNIYYRNSASSSWSTIAFTDSNVASATKMQTPRTIWGQSFDGSGNVIGDLSGVGNITATGNIDTSGRLLVGNKRTNDNFGIETNTNIHVYNWTNAFLYNNGTTTLGGVLLGHRVIPILGTLETESLGILPDGGNVLIGTITDYGYKLDVSGTGRFTDTVTAPTFIGALSGNAATATNLSSARTFSATGDATGSVSSDLSAGFSISLTLANSGVTAGTYRSVTVDAKGRVTSGTNPTTLAGYGITDAAPISHSNISGEDTIHHTHSNKTYLNSINQSMATTSDVSFNSLTAVSRSKAPVFDLGNLWTIEAVGTEIQIKYDGILKQKMLNDGSFAAVGELTAYVAGSSGYSEFLPLTGGAITGSLTVNTDLSVGGNLAVTGDLGLATQALSLKGNALTYNGNGILYNGLSSITLANGWTIEATATNLYIKKDGVTKGTF